MKIINFLNSLFLLGLLFAENVNALSRPTGDIARSRASMQQRLQSRQSRWDSFAASRREGSPKVFEQIQSIDPAQAIGLRKDVLHESKMADMIGRCKENEIFIFSKDLPDLGFCISPEEIPFSGLINKAAHNNTLYGGDNKISVPFSLDAIDDGIGFLRTMKRNLDLDDLYQAKNVDYKTVVDKSIKPEVLSSFDRIVNVTNVLDYLQCDLHIKNIFLSKIKSLMDNGKQDIVKSAAFHQLSRDYQEVLMSDYTDKFFKQAIMQKNNQKFRINIAQKADVSSDGEKIVFIDKNNKEILNIIYSAKTGFAPKRIFGAHPYSCATISPDGSTIVATTNARIEMLKIENLDKTEFMKFQKDEAISSIVCNRNGSIIVLLDQSGEVLRCLSYKQRFLGERLFSDKKNISKVIVNSNGDKIVAISDNKLIISHSGRKITTITYSSPIKGVMMNPRSASFICWAASVADPTIDVIQKVDFDSIDEAPHNITIGYQENILAAAQSYDDKYAASLGEGGLIVWDRKDNTALFKGLSELGASLVAFSHDGKNLMLYSNRDDKLICYSIAKLLGGNRGTESINPEFIITDVGGKNSTYSGLSCSDDDRKIILSGDSTLVKTLMTDAQVSVLNKIKNECSIEQRRLIYELAWDFAHDTPMQLEEGSSEFALFKTIPGDIQDVLFDLVGIHEVQGYGPANPSWQARGWYQLWQLRQSLKGLLPK